MASKGAIIVVKKEKDTHFLANQGFSKEIRGLTPRRSYRRGRQRRELNAPSSYSKPP